jgi:hypothetical protein
MSELLNQQYVELKLLATRELGGRSVAGLICDMAAHSHELLDRCERVKFTSKVAGKQYFGFRGVAESRPINDSLYINDPNEFKQSIGTFLLGLSDEPPDSIVRIVYTIACNVLAAHDVIRVGRKASATFFEILIGHIVAGVVGVLPRKKVRIPESGADLPTDYVFDPGPNSRKLHLPIKTSTRERAVQAWVHQLVLERIFGSGAYKGVLVVSGETKRNTKTDQVIEICVPKQLQMFQSRVTEISRVYYLDPPQVYLSLTNSFPRVEVKSFGEVFEDLPPLLHS